MNDDPRYIAYHWIRFNRVFVDAQQVMEIWDNEYRNPLKGALRRNIINQAIERWESENVTELHTGVVDEN